MPPAETSQVRLMRPLFQNSESSEPNRETPPAPEPDSPEFWEAKLAALAEFAAGAGHEINNPLAVIINRAQRLLQDETDPQRRRELAAIGAQAYRIRDMIGDAMLFARPPEPAPQSCSLEPVFTEVAEKLADDFRERNVTLAANIESCPPLWADPLQLKIVLSSLLRNSAEAIGKDGEIHVKADSTLVADRAFVRLCVTDNGPGLSDLDRQHLFDPFYSGRQAGRGLGFGLSKCWRIIDGHGGRIEVVESKPEETTLQVFWPAADTDIQRQDSAE